MLNNDVFEDKSNNELLINHENDLISVRKKLRELTELLGFSLIDVTRIVTSASELTRNILLYAGSGVVYYKILNDHAKKGLELSFIDYGPGIEDIEQVLVAGYTTSGGLGLGLPGAKRLMDEMYISSEVGKGTTIVIRKWLKKI